MMQEISTTTVGPQLIIGKRLYQPDQKRGALVQPLLTPLPEATPQSIVAPVYNRPAPLADLIDREAEAAWAVELLRQGTSVTLYGEAGIGKTALMHHLAHHPFTEKFVDGVVYVSLSQQPVEDVLYLLYANFYESAIPHKPTSDELRQRLQSKTALIILDDFDLGSEDLRLLQHAAPSCTFLVASVRSVGQQEGTRALSGLPTEAAVALVAQVLGRPLTAAEQETASAISTALKGHPLRLKQSVAAATLQNLPLSAVLEQLPGATAVDNLNLRQLGQQLVAALDNAAWQGVYTALAIGPWLQASGDIVRSVPELLEFVAQEGLLLELITYCEQAYPDLTWGEPTQSLVDAGIAALPPHLGEIVSVLAAVGDRPLSEELIGYLSDKEDVSSPLADLLRYGLVQNNRYHLGGSLPYRFYGEVEPILLRVVDWVQAGDDEATLLREAQTVAYLQQWAMAHNRPEAAWRLGRALEETLALNGRWDLWQQVLYTTQAAAQALQDTAGEAWVLNQLGCRALCLGIDSSAQTYLERARQLNEKIGDEAAAAVNQHNLNVLHGPPPLPSPWRRRFIYLIGIGLLVLGLLIWWLTRTAFTPPVVSTPTATPTVVILQTLTPLPTQSAVPPTVSGTVSITATVEAQVLPTTTPEPQTLFSSPDLPLVYLPLYFLQVEDAGVIEQSIGN